MKLNKLFNIVLASAFTLPLFTSCDSDTDSNPTFQEAESFVLNESAYATNNTIDLSAEGTVVSLTCNQPDYGGFPVATVYSVQLSFDGLFSDESSYTTMTTTFTSTNIDIDASEMNSSLVSLWASVYGEDVEVSSDPIAVYIRLTALVSGQSIGYCESNVICLPSVLISASAVSEIELETWYLCGNNIGDGTWGNDGVDNVGVSLWPLAYVSEGVISWTGYLESGEFKLIKIPGSWAYEYGELDGSYVTSGGSNITVDAGYYTITLDYVNENLTIEEYTGTVTEYTTMGISGDFNDWGFTEIENATGSTHLWRTEFSSDEDTTLKFLIDSDWTMDWGSDTFPSGMGVKWGSNIPVTAGSYIVILNDIDGGYTFVEK